VGAFLDALGSKVVKSNEECLGAVQAVVQAEIGRLREELRTSEQAARIAEELEETGSRLADVTAEREVALGRAETLQEEIKRMQAEVGELRE
jgi:chromosome segregation ATPase